MSFEEPEISLVPLGGCRKPKIGTTSSGESTSNSGTRHDSCVLLPDECAYEYVNPLDTNVIVDHPTCNGVAATPIGHCGSIVLGEKRQCAVHPDACRDPDSWVRPSQSMSQYVNVNFGCTILQDLNYHNDKHDYHEGGGLTHYIGCRGGLIESDWLNVNGGVTSDGAVCVATVPECRELIGLDNDDDQVNDDSQSVEFEINLAHPECDCSETRTGACFRMKDALDSTVNVMDRYFCAVSKEVCDDDPDLGLTYQSVDQLMRYSNIDCRLCDARTVMNYKIAVKKAMPESGSGNVAAIFGIAIGSALGSALFLMILHFGFSWLTGAKTPQPQPQQPPPAGSGSAAPTTVDAGNAEHAKVHDAEFS
eukprot:jgi/Psemu1/33869/gm1.33869_g